MLVLYSLLHAGPVHMLGNLAGLWMLERMLLARMGALGLVALWVVGALMGGVVFGLIASSTAVPMVGASGAVFALAGAWGWFEANRHPTGPRRWRRRIELAGVGIAINLAMVYLTDGGVAWETHLGGALAGIILAMAYSPKRTPP
jgi:membrane associated rhomboid family serine protease